MEWLNIHVSTLDAEEMLDADPCVRSTWLMLLRYCIGQENGGKIAGARDWPPVKCIRNLRVTKEEINQPSALWSWEGADIVVRDYPIEKERQVRSNRENGRSASVKRWNRQNGDVTATAPGTPLEMPSKNPEGAEGVEHHSSIESNAADSEVPGIEAPSLQEVLDWGTKWSGEPASATPPFDSAWLEDWFEFRSNSVDAGFNRYRDWRRRAVFDWRNQWRGWPAKKAAREAGPNVRTGGVWAKRQRLAVICAEMKEHPANPHSSAYVGDEHLSLELTQAWNRLRADRVGLEEELRQ